MSITHEYESGRIIRSFGSESGGNNTPFWSDAQKSVLPYNYFSYHKSNRFSPLGTVEDWPGDYTYDNFTQPHSGEPSDGPAHSESIKHLYNRVGSVDLQALVSLAEAPRTFSLLAGSAKNLARAFLSFKRFDVVGAMRHLGVNDIRKGNKLSRSMHDQYQRNTRISKRDVAASRWLELQYGWLPLIGECHSAVEVLNKKLIQDQGMLLRFRSNGSAASVSTFNSVFGIGEKRYDIKIKYNAVCEVLDPENRAIAVLGVSNPASVVWELVPFSFVADWFIPIGSWIAAQTAMQGLVFRAGGFGKEVKIREKDTLKKCKVSRFQTRTCHLTLNDHDVRYTRTPMYSMPAASRMLSLSSIQDAMGLRRTASALALLRVAFK